MVPLPTWIPRPPEPVQSAALTPKASDEQRVLAIYEMLFERNPDGIAFSDSQGNLIFNASALEMLRVDKQGDDSGVEKWQAAYGLFLPDGKTPHPAETLPMTRALVNRETVRDHELITKIAKFGSRAGSRGPLSIPWR